MPARAIRFVTPRFGADVIGGAESLVRQIARNLVARDWDVEVWTSTALDEATWQPELPAGESTDEGIAVRRFAPRWSRRPEMFHQFSRGFFRLPGLFRPEWLWIRAQGPYTPSLVHELGSAPIKPTVFMPYLFYPTLAGVPAARHPRILMPAAHDERPLRLRAVTNAINSADALWCATPEEWALLGRVHPSSQRKPYVIGNVGVTAPTALTPRAFRDVHGIDGTYFYYGGRRTPGKGYDVLIEGFRRLRERVPNVQLVVSGSTAPDRGPPERGVVNVGRLTEEDRWNAIAGAAAVVVPGRHESLSLLALEGWAAGRPALLNSMSDVLSGQAARSGGALLFEDAGSFAERAAELVSNTAKAAELGAQGKAYVAATYTWDGVVESLEHLLDRIAPR